MKRFKHTLIVLLVAMAMMVFTQNNLLAATATVDTNEVHQTMEGFGAAVAWYITSLATHAEKGEIFDYLFYQLGLDILRLRNIYDRGEDGYFADYAEIVDSFYSKSTNSPKVYISSWSPPADMKSNGSTTDGGTLDTNSSGEYVYDDFAQYWEDALYEFSSYGIDPDYISIQNEPSFAASHETCELDPTENSTNAGYDQALDSVYNRLQYFVSPPKILAPEVLGIGYNLFQNYAAQFNHDHAYGYAYHLYHGGDGNVNPDAFNSNLTTIANSYTGKPIFQTEYDYGGWFNTIWLMHNCLVHGNVSGYLYWRLCWGSGTEDAFITFNGSAYTVHQIYWGFRQYSKAVHYGWKRVGASVSADSLKITAFIGPWNNNLSIIVLNVSHSEDSVDLDIPGFDISGANMIRTSDGEENILVGYYDGSTVNLPARSITTISTLYISPAAGIEDKDDNNLNTGDCSLSQNYPNPFTTMTAIEYSISEASFVRLAVYDVSGREIEVLVNERMQAGSHTVRFDADKLSSGIYFCQLEAGGKRVQRKMILMR